MRNVAYLGVFLMLICSVSAGALAITNRVTGPLIEEHQAATRAAAMAEVLPAAAAFEDITGELGELLSGYPDVDSVNVGHAEDGGSVGYVFSVSCTGYVDDIVILVGISDEQILGMRILQQTETPGLGAMIATDRFTGQFYRLPTGAPVALTRDGGQVDAVAGATVSSRAVVEGVEQARSLYADIGRER